MYPNPKMLARAFVERSYRTHKSRVFIVEENLDSSGFRDFYKFGLNVVSCSPLARPDHVCRLSSADRSQQPRGDLNYRSRWYCYANRASYANAETQQDENCTE